MIIEHTVLIESNLTEVGYRCAERIGQPGKDRIELFGDRIKRTKLAFDLFVPIGNFGRRKKLASCIKINITICLYITYRGRGIKKPRLCIRYIDVLCIECNLANNIRHLNTIIINAVFEGRTTRFP